MVEENKRGRILHSPHSGKIWLKPLILQEIPVKIDSSVDLGKVYS